MQSRFTARHLPAVAIRFRRAIGCGAKRAAAHAPLCSALPRTAWAACDSRGGAVSEARQGRIRWRSRSVQFATCFSIWSGATLIGRTLMTAHEDDRAAASGSHRRFSHGTRPVIRWIKGGGLDDPITRAAIGQATRLFGDRVDYCLCTSQIGADRARSVLEWAVQPVEWWPVSPADNPILAEALTEAGCPPEHFGYWWKWFPERVRENAPEWILDGDMVITARPAWFEDWARGDDVCRMTQDDRWPLEGLYGSYIDLVDADKRLYSGLISLPPALRYMNEVSKVFAARPLARGHDGRRDMCEQGVIATAFQRIGARPIPLHEFPFGRTFQPELDFGLRGDRGDTWGYHFGNAFMRGNAHFDRLVNDGVIFSGSHQATPVERFSWLGASGNGGCPAGRCPTVAPRSCWRRPSPSSAAACSNSAPRAGA